ncbi:MAG: nucleotidyl transferase AbiEii/AbiGii toxin family protein [bacterium]|nr:nucleotidyl transferase AbiEii/AbiGii toxin family protein [bacterium]
MLTLPQIEEQYPEHLRPYKRAILREYLQYKILAIIADSEYAPKLSFLGGTALRIIYNNTRFSEDLDFNNFGLKEGEFEAMSRKVKKGLEAQGLKVEMSFAGKDAYRCNIRLPEILYGSGLSPHEGEKILMQIDSVAHDFLYTPDKKIMNKFDVFSEVFVTPLPILLSQKIYAAVNRKRAKGRDFFDIVFLLSLTRPNYAYLKTKICVDNPALLRERMLETIKNIDFVELGKDVQNFLFHPGDAKKIELFREFIREAPLD